MQKSVPIYTNPLFLKHETGSHPENKTRLTSIISGLKAAGFEKNFRDTWNFDPKAVLPLVHHDDQILAVKQCAASGGGYLDPDTVVSANSYDVAYQAVSAVCDATSQVINGTDASALCLLRPPGHHATESQSMGFCLFNNVAVAAQHALTNFQLTRILIVDWDVHHGNGTQDIFYESDQVYFFSIHRFPFYPGSGGLTETGTGKGLGYTLNAPIAFGTSREIFLESFKRGLETAAAKIKPEIIFISAGFDAHRLDPVGSLGLETEDYIEMTKITKQVAATYCHGRIVSLLEGGYHVGALAESVRAHYEALL